MVLLDALNDCTQPFDDAHEQTRDRIYTSFAKQAMREGWSPFGDDEMNSRPEFDVLAEDIDFVLGAAKTVLDERSRPERAFNKLARRTKAARSIVSFLKTNTG